jgi:predicted glycoside hydrolase/deacetylase ChbG (UPF0249 family)
MLIINADDWGRSAAETDAALRCYQAGRITSVSAMVFMADCENAAELAKANRLEVGLHLNFSEPFTDNRCPGRVRDCHNRIVSFLKRHKYAQVLYNPALQKQFAYSYHAQCEEFSRLFGRAPSHIDGHHHMHLCANVVISDMIPAGIRMRRSFSFWPGEKSWLNRTYRALIDRWLQRRYHLPDYFFDLTQSVRQKKMPRVMKLAGSGSVELMTHPIICTEFDYLMGDEFGTMLGSLNSASYASFNSYHSGSACL